MGAGRAWMALGAALAMMAGPARAQRPLDCPLRDAPFSTRSPMIDILANADARSMVERAMPGVLAALPEDRFSTVAPSFAAIVTLRDLAVLLGRPLKDPDALDRAFAAIPITIADRAARCSRYDDDRPSVAFSRDDRLHVLLFEKITGFRDGPSVEAAHAAIVEMARRNGWSLVSTDRAGVMSPDILRNVDVVVWNNVSGDVLTLRQRAAFRAYVEKGGGFVGLHGAGGDPAYFWDWYVDMLIGARFAGHTFGQKQFQEARVVVETPGTGISDGLPSGWRMRDEWYSFATNPRLSGAKVVARLDETSYAPEGMWKKDLSMGDHPIAWTRDIENGRSFFTAIGHLPESYTQPQANRMIENGIAWAGQRHREARSRPAVDAIERAEPSWPLTDHGQGRLRCGRRPV